MILFASARLEAKERVKRLDSLTDFSPMLSGKSTAEKKWLTKIMNGFGRSF